MIRYESRTNKYSGLFGTGGKGVIRASPVAKP